MQSEQNTSFVKKFDFVYSMLFNKNAKEMERITGISRQSIANYLQGYSAPGFSNLKELYNYGININWFFDENNNRLDDVFLPDDKGKSLKKNFLNSLPDLTNLY